MKRPDKIVIDYDLGLYYLNIGLSVAFLLFLTSVATRSFIFGSKDGNWVYPYINDFTIKPILIFLLILPIVLFLVKLTQKEIHKNEILIISLWFIVGYICQLLIRSLYPYSFDIIIQSDANAFYGPSIEYGAIDLLRNYDSIAPDLPVHARSNMPGKILFFHFLGIFTSSPNIMGHLIILISNIGALLTYAITKILFQNKLIAIYSLILYLFIPAKLFLLPIINTISPVFMLLSLYLFLQYFESKNDIYLILLGFSLYLVLFFDPLILFTGIIFLAYFVKYYWEKKVTTKQALKIGIYTFGTFFVIYVLFRLVLNYDIIKNFLDNMDSAVEFNTSAGRNYGIWIFRNLVLYFVNVGFVQSLLVFCFLFIILAKMIEIYKNGETRIKNIVKYAVKPGQFLAISFMVFLLVIDLLGVNRGEITRLWIFHMVFIQIIVAYFCVNKLDQKTFYLVLAATILQAAIGVTMIGFIKPSELILQY